MARLYGNSAMARLYGNSAMARLYGNSAMARLYGNSAMARLYGNNNNFPTKYHHKNAEGVTHSIFVPPVPGLVCCRTTTKQGLTPLPVL